MRGRLFPRIFKFVSGIILSKLFHFVIFHPRLCFPISLCFIMLFKSMVAGFFFITYLAGFHFLYL